MQTALQATQLRLANHYLQKLRQASVVARHSYSQRDVAFSAMMQDWEQIAHWQAWAVAGTAQDAERARLAAAFPLGAEAALSVWQSPPRQLDWVRQALEAARALHDDAAELELLYQTAMLCLTVETLDEAAVYGAEFMALAVAANDTLTLGRAWYVQATLTFTRGDYTAAEHAFHQALPYFEASHAPAAELPYIWRGLARLAQFRGDYVQAEIGYRRHLDIAIESGSEQDVIDARIAISGVYLALRDYAAAETMAAQAVTQSRAHPRSRLFARSVLALAHAQKWLGKLEDACESYARAVTAARVVSPPSSLINALYGWGQALYMRGDPGAALQRFEEALPIARAVPHPLRICEVAHDSVFAHIACGDLAAARACLREACEVAQQLGTPHFLAKVVAAALTLAYHDGHAEQAAGWAAVVQDHAGNLHPSLFDPSVYTRIEAAIGSARYAELHAHGQQQPLAAAFEDVAAMQPL